jgi:hypothetical protein
MGAFTRAKMLATGLDVRGMLEEAKIRELLKTALPERSDFIDANSHSAYFNLLDELEEKLLLELQRMMEGREVDEQSIERSAELANKMKTVMREQATAEAAAAVKKLES